MAGGDMLAASEFRRALAREFIMAVLLIAVASVLALIYIKKIQEPYIILIGALLGLMIKTQI